MIESFQLHAIPDLLEEQKDAIDAYMTQNYRGLDSDLCACCIRNADLSSLACTQCHGKDTKAFLEGHSLVLECQSCGCRVVGASFYSPCEQDRKPYCLWIREDRIPASVLVKLGSMLHIGVLEMKRQIENREKLNRSLSLKEIMEASRFLKEEGMRAVDLEDVTEDMVEEPWMYADLMRMKSMSAGDFLLCKATERMNDRDQLKYTLRRVRRRLAFLLALNEKIKRLKKKIKGKSKKSIDEEGNR